ncbi:MAG: response regulator [Chitinispirillaceae bacterium]|nr:response regulator [Chitinispirillaceae bacterium]
MKYTILLIDPEDWTREMTRSYLEKFPYYKIYSIADPFQALNYISIMDENLDLIITEVNLPGMDGFEFIDKALNIIPTAKTILFTNDVKKIPEVCRFPLIFKKAKNLDTLEYIIRRVLQIEF